MLQQENENQLMDLKRKNGELELKLRELKISVDSLSEKNQNFEQDSMSIREENAQLKAEIVRLTAELDRITLEKGRLQSDFDKLRQDSEKQIRNITTDNTMLKDRLARSEREIQGLKTQISQHKLDIDRLRLDLEASQDLNAHISQARIAREETMSNLLNAKQQLTLENQQLSASQDQIKLRQVAFDIQQKLIMMCMGEKVGGSGVFSLKDLEKWLKSNATEDNQKNWNDLKKTLNITPTTIRFIRNIKQEGALIPHPNLKAEDLDAARRGISSFFSLPEDQAVAESILNLWTEVHKFSHIN